MIDGSNIQSIVIFFISSLCKKKLDAIGIAKLPAALRSYRDAKKEEAKRKLAFYAVGIFHSLAVVSGLLARWPGMIQANAVFNILVAIKDSIDARQEEEAQMKEAADAKRPHRQRGGGSITRAIRRLLFSSDSNNAKDAAPSAGETQETRGKSKTEKAQTVVKKTKSIIRGKRDSATDDIIWGAFQISFVLCDQTIGKALACAWTIFLLTVLEEALLNPKLKKGQRVKRLVWILVTGYMTGRFAIPDFAKKWW